MRTQSNGLSESCHVAVVNRDRCDRLKKGDRRRRAAESRERQIARHGFGRGRLSATAGEHIVQGMAFEVLNARRLHSEPLNQFFRTPCMNSLRD